MFECKRIEERNQAGNLVAVGVEWTEHKEWFDTLMALAMFLCLLVGLFTMFLVSPFVKQWWFSVGIGLALVVLGFSLFSVEIPGRPRQLLFYRDGRMLAPLGFAAYAARYKSMSGHLADVVSIEARQTASTHDATKTAYTHGVVLFKRGGDVTYIAKHLHPDAAHKVAVQLTLALTELREALATATTTRAEPRAQGRARPTVEVFID